MSRDQRDEAKQAGSAGGPNTLGNARVKKKHDNEGQEGGQYGGSQGVGRPDAGKAGMTKVAR